jgi:PKD repeat protein
MNRFRISSLVAVLLGLSAAMVLSFFEQLPAHGQGQPLPTRHVREAVSSGQAARVGRLPATQSLKLSIALPLRNESQLNQVLQQLYDPQSPSYHRFLSVNEFTERFGPSQDDYDAVISFAQSKGLTVKGTAANRRIVDVTGPVANIEAAFHVNMGVYQHPTENRTFYAPDREPAADLPVALWHISGLNNFSIPRPAGLRRAPEAERAASGSAPDGSGAYIGSDMRAAYYGSGTLTGIGHTVGVLAFGTWLGGLSGNVTYNLDMNSVKNDVASYFSSVKQPLNVPIYGVSTDGSSLSCTNSPPTVNCGDVEQASDIEEVISMAPGLSQVIMYVAQSSDADIFNRMATDNIAKILNCSWYWYPDDPTEDDPFFEEFAAQGQSLFVASGDFGSFPNNPNPYYYPAEDAYVTSVGGTVLTTTGPGGVWESETAWSDSGGGISPDNIPIPAWQQTTGVITGANGGSTIYRNIPDVAIEAAYDNYVCYSGNEGGDGSGPHCDNNWGGTSFAAPRWAGYMALVNQQSVTSTGSPVGFLNSAIYTIGLGSSYGADFHDITIGSNGAYSAETGYDLVTGWGSPVNGTRLISDLINLSPPPCFTASPTSGKAPLKVHFSDRTVGSFTKWLWHFGDGRTSKTRNPTHVYSRARTYTVTLTSIGAGGTTTCTQPSYITAYPAPKARFSAEPRSGDAPLVVNFTNKSTGIVTSWLWHFGDGTTTSTDWNPTHTYDSHRTYTAKLTVSGPGGRGSKTMSITVKK